MRNGRPTDPLAQRFDKGASNLSPIQAEQVSIRQAQHGDGAGMWQVVKDCGVLDLNSAYLYMLQANHFAETCAVATVDERIVGLVTGHCPPNRPGAVFLWQVGIRPEAQGLGLGKKLVSAFLKLPGAEGAVRLETTITPSNEASRALFKRIAADLDADFQVSPFFTADEFPDAGHEPEELITITPLNADAIKHL
jgi:L-2,4-diaminobutyric acid acetyltransferase